MATFERIHREQMAGLPLLNPALTVATVGFQAWQGRVLGMVITPWMMNLILFPGPGDDWSGRALGAKETLQFPGGSFRFMSNTIEGIGLVQMHSVHSPMHAFPDQATAIDAAETFLKQLLEEPADGHLADPYQEELLGRVLRGERVPELEAELAGVSNVGDVGDVGNMAGSRPANDALLSPGNLEKIRI